MNNVDEDYEALLQLAVAIFRRSPLAGEGGFNMRDAMVMAGVEKEVAETEIFKNCMQRLLKWKQEIELLSRDDAKVI
jgi:hypothetical protein